MTRYIRKTDSECDYTSWETSRDGKLAVSEMIFDVKKKGHLLGEGQWKK